MPFILLPSPMNSRYISFIKLHSQKSQDTLFTKSHHAFPQIHPTTTFLSSRYTSLSVPCLSFPRESGYHFRGSAWYASPSSTMVGEQNTRPRNSGAPWRRRGRKIGSFSPLENEYALSCFQHYFVSYFQMAMKYV